MNRNPAIVYGPILAVLVIGVFGGLVYFKSDSNPKKKFRFPDSNNALSEAKQIISNTVPVSRDEIKSAITNSKFSRLSGGSRRRCKKVGKRKTRGRQ